MTMTMVDCGPEQAGISYVCIQFLYFLKCLFWRENITLFLQVGLRGQAEQREQASVCAGICYMFFCVFWYFILYFLQVGLGLSGQARRLVCAPAGETQWQAARQPGKSQSSQLTRLERVGKVQQQTHRCVCSAFQAQPQGWK